MLQYVLRAASWSCTVRWFGLRSLPNISPDTQAPHCAPRYTGDDDDVHPPDQVSALVCPILRGETELSVLTFSYLAKVDATGATFHRYGRTTQAFLGSIAYKRVVASQNPSSRTLCQWSMIVRISTTQWWWCADHPNWRTRWKNFARSQKWTIYFSSWPNSFILPNFFINF